MSTHHLSSNCDGYEIKYSYIKKTILNILGWAEFELSDVDATVTVTC